MAARKWFLWLALTGVLVMFGGLAQAEMPLGVTDTEIHIGQWGPQTGPAALWGAVARGTGIYFKMINAEGGIHGRKIVYHMFDDGYNPARTKAGVKELQEKEPGIFAWASGVGTAPGMAVKDYLMKNKIPWVGPSAGSLQWITPPQRYLFADYPLYYVEAQVLVRYAVKKLGYKKIAILYVNDEYGKNGLRGARKELKRLGVKPVIEVSVGRGDKDLKSHVMKLKKSGAEAVLLWVNPTHCIIAVKTAAAMKFKARWMSSSTLSDVPMMMKVTGGLWKDAIFTAFTEPPEDLSNPLMKKYYDAYKKYAKKGERWGVFLLAGFAFVEPMVEGLKRAGRNLTREGFVDAMETIKNFKGVLGTINYGPLPQRQGTNEVYVAKPSPDGKKMVRLTDWQTAPMD